MWLSNKTADNMRQWIAAHTVLVAVQGEQITGVAAVRADGQILLNYVAPEARFQGASKCLMQGIEAWASSRGLNSLTLDSTATALRFYLSTGWTMTGPPQPGFGVTTGNPMRKPVTVSPAEGAGGAPPSRLDSMPIYQIGDRGDRVQQRQVEIDFGKIDAVIHLDGHDDFHRVQGVEPPACEQQLFIVERRKVASHPQSLRHVVAHLRSNFQIHVSAPKRYERKSARCPIE
jgi:Acetyltransferase (GNAT) domain